MFKRVESARLVMDAPREAVWQAITDPDNFDKWLPGITTYFDFRRANASVGTEFAANHPSQGRLAAYVTHWQPLTEFGWGLSKPPAQPRFYFRLEESGDGTIVHYVNKLPLFTWLTMPWEHPFMFIIFVGSWPLRLAWRLAGRAEENASTETLKKLNWYVEDNSKRT